MTENKEKGFLFSVVIPVYNVQQYLREAVDSIINQTIGFEKNIQIILINDGSKDKSGDICEEYQKKHPHNIIYVNQQNAGVSAARNKGIELAEGKYVNFLDSDDKWDVDVFKKVYDFFEKEYDYIDVVSCRICFFEGKKGFSHALDYKYNKNKIVEIFEEYDNIQLSSASAFIKRDVIKRHRFNSSVKYSEDALLMSMIILEKERYGILSDAVYYYRKRLAGNSAIDNSTKDKSWYTDTLEIVQKGLFNYSKQKYGRVIRYIQYQIMYDLQWYIMGELPDTLTEEEKTDYINSVKLLLQDIEDIVISAQRRLPIEGKVYAINLKYGKNIVSEFTFDKGVFRYCNAGIFNIKLNRLFTVYILRIEGDNLHIEGKISGILNDSSFEKYIMTDNHQRIELEYYDIDFLEERCFTGEDYLSACGFKAVIPLKKTKSFKLMVSYNDRYITECSIIFDKFAYINSKLSYSYYIGEKYIVKQKYNNVLIYKKTPEKHFKLELRYMQQLLKIKEYEVVICRILYYLLKAFYKRPIWIVSDRTNITNDNGMHFFTFLRKEKSNKNNCYFAIDKNAEDYKKMKRIGKVLKIGSMKYMLTFLLADKIISSQGDDWVINAFRSKSKYLKDLYKFDFVFLQHGIIKDDLSKWLHKLNKNIDIFVTSAEDEWKSIAFGNYGYTPDEVKLTGLPRYDKLENGTLEKIVFMPTWRAGIAKKTKAGTSEREYDDSFKNSEYFTFYNALINDERVLKALKDKGYTGKFCIHPSFEKQAVDFHENDFIKIDTSEVDYQKEFKENKLLITDFSSVAFDFCYLNKPVVYTQFDADTFFEGQIYDKGYFSYEDNGFGPVCYDYESSVAEIVKSIESGCLLEQKYQDRINSFYKYHDKDNCKRVYNEIVKMGKRRDH